MTKRPVIVHFHLFKNAGTSVDKILKSNFKDRWVEIEGNLKENSRVSRKLDAKDLIEFIRGNPQFDVISSHTAVVSMPELDDIQLLPIVFFRHPIDRIRSAYDFERKQDANTPGAINAKQGDFEYYMNWRLSTPAPWQILNFHAVRFKDFYAHTPAKQRELFLPRAIEAIDSLPFVGRVEEFDTSMKVYEKWLKAYFPHFKALSARENVTSGKDASMFDNLVKFEARVGKKVYQRLLDINQDDMALYDYVKMRFDERLAKVD